MCWDMQVITSKQTTVTSLMLLNKDRANSAERVTTEAVLHKQGQSVQDLPLVAGNGSKAGVLTAMMLPLETEQNRRELWFLLTHTLFDMLDGTDNHASPS